MHSALVVEWASIVRRLRSSRFVVVAPPALTTAAAAASAGALAFMHVLAAGVGNHVELPYWVIGVVALDHQLAGFRIAAGLVPDHDG
jgi:hypothetical protein